MSAGGDVFQGLGGDMDMDLVAGGGESAQQVLSADQLPSEVCELCGESVVGHAGELKVTGSTVAHMACVNAKRCLQRMLNKNTDLKRNVGTMKLNDPKKYQGIVMSLASRPNGRTHEQRAMAMAFMQELSSETVVRTKRSVLMLSERQFKAWYMHNEGCSKEEAAQKWEEDVSNQDIGRECVNGVVHLAVQMPTEVSAIEQVAKRKKLVHESAVEGEEGMRAAFSALRERAPITDAAFNSMDRHALLQGAASSSSSGPSAQGAAGALAGDVFSAGAGLAGLRSPASQRAPSVTPTKPAPPTSTSGAPQGKADDGASATTSDVSGVGGDGNAANNEREVPLTKLDACNLTPATFIKLKRQLQDLIKEKISNIEGSKRRSSMLTTLEESYEEVKDDVDIKALDVPAAVQNTKNKIADIRRLSDRVGGWKFADYKKSDCEAVFTQAAGLCAEVSAIQQLMEAIDETKKQLSKQKAKDSRACRYQKRKAMSELVKAGVPKHLAFCFATVLNTLADNDEGRATMGALYLETVKPCDTVEAVLYPKDCDQDLYLKIKGMVGDNQGTFEGMKTKLLNAQARAVAFAPVFKANSGPELFKDIFTEVGPESFEGEGLSKPWLLTVKKNNFAWCFQSWPWAGLPCCVYALDHPLCIMAVPLASMLEDGLANLDSICEFLKAGDKAPASIDGGRIFYIGEADMVFIPGGWVPLVMGASDGDSNSTVVVQHIMDLSILKEMPGSAACEVIQYTERNLNKLSKARPWSVLSGGMKKFTSEWSAFATTT